MMHRDALEHIADCGAAHGMLVDRSGEAARGHRRYLESNHEHDHS